MKFAKMSKTLQTYNRYLFPTLEILQKSAKNISETSWVQRKVQECQHRKNVERLQEFMAMKATGLALQLQHRRFDGHKICKNLQKDNCATKLYLNHKLYHLTYLTYNCGRSFLHFLLSTSCLCPSKSIRWNQKHLSVLSSYQKRIPNISTPAIFFYKHLLSYIHYIYSWVEASL